MAKIYVGFSSPKTWKPFAEAIKLAEGTQFSHIYIRMPTKAKYGQDLIYHASGLAVNFMSSVIFESHNNIIKEFELDIDPETYNKTIAFAISKAGIPYGVKQILGIAICILGRKLGKTWKNPFADGDCSYICSELVAEIARNCWGISIADDLQLIDPKTLYSLFESKAP